MRWPMVRRGVLGLACAAAVGLISGCDGDPRAPYERLPGGAAALSGVDWDSVVVQGAGASPVRRPVQLGGSRPAPASAAAASESDANATSVRAALRQLQVMVGEWRGNTFRDNAVHEAHWLWDLKTDPKQPALVMQAEKNPFFEEARLTYLPGGGKYRLTLTDPAGEKRQLEGGFVEEPKSEPGEDGRTIQRTFKLAFEQVTPISGEQWSVLLNQQENNRFLMDLSKRRGTAPFRKFDTVSEQRQGTSFAFSDEGYGQKTCVISGGLGTTSVSYNGKTYWVCCSGCKAAFEDDPEKWIAEFEKKQAAN